MNLVTLKLHFAAGHRILGLSGAGAKCRNIHGHTFTVTWEFAQSEQWPPAVEFGEAKVVLRELIKGRFDHTFFVDPDDDFLEYLRANNLSFCTTGGPPTTEAIAGLVAGSTMDLLPDADLLRVHLGEGPENAAVWCNPDRDIYQGRLDRRDGRVRSRHL